MIEVITTENCGACAGVKAFLTLKGIEFNEYTKEEKPEQVEKAKAKNIKSFPIVTHNGVMWGGFDLLRLKAIEKKEKGTR